MKPSSPTPKLFDDLSQYWTEIADAHSTEKQANFVKNQVRTEGLVLDLACGSGRHSISLGKVGYDIVGLDVSSNLLRKAKNTSSGTSSKLNLVRADMRFLPFWGAAFSAVLSLDSSFGYLQSEEEDLMCLKEIARVLDRGGVFLIDVFNRERVICKYRRSTLIAYLEFHFLKRFPWLGGLFRWTEYPGFSMLSRRGIDEKNDTIRDLWVFRDNQTCKTFVAVHVIRLYSVSKLSTLLEKACFGSFRSFGGYEGQIYSADSSRLIVVSSKT